MRQRSTNGGEKIRGPDKMSSGPLLRYVGISIIIMVSYGAIHKHHPHQPFRWSLIRWEDQQTVQQVITAGAPSFRTTPCNLTTWSTTWCPNNQTGLYFCPSSNPGKGIAITQTSTTVHIGVVRLLLQTGSLGRVAISTCK